MQPVGRRLEEGSRGVEDVCLGIWADSIVRVSETDVVSAPCRARCVPLCSQNEMASVSPIPRSGTQWSPDMVPSSLRLWVSCGFITEVRQLQPVSHFDFHSISALLDVSDNSEWSPCALESPRALCPNRAHFLSPFWPPGCWNLCREHSPPASALSPGGP